LKNSYLTAGITLKHLFRLLLRNKISCHPRYLVRIFFLFQSACWSSLFSMTEKTRFAKSLGTIEKIPAPVFIIGHWRTGTTLLHKLMSLDPNLKAPTLFDVAIPDGFLSSYKFYKPIMKLMVSPHRPMDMVKMGIDEPQEDEYAIFRLTGCSPLERLIFPVSPGYFLMTCDSFLPTGEKRVEWEKSVLLFFKKLYHLSGKTIVSKNPFNSLRINELRKIFPEARFIHIYRNPLKVIPSTVNMFDIVQKQNCLNKNGARPTIAEVSEIYDNIMKVIRRDLSALPHEFYHEIRFEDLESDPVGSLKSLYQALKLEFSDELEEKVRVYLSEVKDYQKNEFHLTEEEKNTISVTLEHHMKYYRYL
jgi:omega-hydroxy-beta-dihydromenaquinone-9 sulfotransferase